MRSTRLAAFAIAGTLAVTLVGCGTTDPGGAGETGENDTTPNDTTPNNTAPNDTRSDESTTDAEADAGAGASSGGDYLRLDGEELLFGFDEYTVDPNHQYSQLITHTCHPNMSRTGLFHAIGWMVDDDNDVILEDRGWIGRAHISLPIDEKAAAKAEPFVQLDLKHPELVLSTNGAVPSEIDGTFTVDGETATGDFMVPEFNGGPAQRIEFRITCPADD